MEARGIPGRQQGRYPRDPQSGAAGVRLFPERGSTRRQGIEAQINLASKALQLYASYALVDARFLDTLQVGSNSPFADANGNVQIQPGNRIPGIPRNRIKAGIDYSITDAFKVGGDALFIGGGRSATAHIRPRQSPDI